MKVIVVHDANGRIISITQVNADSKQGVGVAAEAGEVVTELELPAEVARKPLLDLHKEYVIDPQARKLVKRP